tara:strand:- start:4291 stop:4641 length:351 start_codon:yes stop_codon:yes gene_type:complete
MANTFKVVTRASVDHSSADTIYTCPGSTTTIILSMTICNRHSSATDIDVILVSDTAGGNPNTNEDVYLLKDTDIPAKSTLEVFAGQKIVLQATDSITAQAAADNYIDISMSFMEIT